MIWKARKFWQQNHEYNCPQSRKFQTQDSWIHYKRTQFLFNDTIFLKPPINFAVLPAHDRQTDCDLAVQQPTRS